ncbi:protein kinase [Theileria orientalis strain Shintoku]|uniref:non-specific serine/threonine protein kinase n=1 Tax=Theileria orientalis strain Shintoku TaxID=869250 RepID=J4C2X2_THEOR|nr:protein kinase [Theileria orientalis strain Shintoku]BAM39436.1 protein kinase [Theileria orientalis strain Shintoku]|eukprot:XP_009689737.1 protein kinase [Theileria orientalis strain Shintoku]
MSDSSNLNLDEYEIVTNFKLVKILSKGPLGNTALLCDNKGTCVVRKRFNISLITNTETKLCLNEIDIISKMSHPFIVKYICSYVEGKYLSIITDYCRGGDLHKYILNRNSKNKPIEEERILIWLTQILSALKFLHKNHILHRDLKTLNILIDSNKDLKICDFGVSKALNRTSDNTGTLIGTPYYFSPELVNGYKYGFPSDIWAVGCILYELCTFRTPFHGAKGIVELTRLINENEVPNLPLSYSPELNSLYKSMMIKDHRYRLTATELLSTEILQLYQILGNWECKSTKSVRKSKRTLYVIKIK